MNARTRRIFISCVLGVGIAFLLMVVVVGGCRDRDVPRTATQKPAGTRDSATGHAIGRVQSRADGHDCESVANACETCRKEMQKTTERYETLKGTPGVVWGRVDIGRENHGLLQMSLGPKTESKKS